MTSAELCMHVYVRLYQKCACVCAGMWYRTWETQQGFCCFSAEWRRGQPEGGQAVITNSIHFRNNNTALWVNRRLFSCGRHWSGPTHLLSLAVTSQEGALAQPQSGPLIFFICTLHIEALHTHWKVWVLCVAGEYRKEKTKTSEAQKIAQHRTLYYFHWEVLFAEW